MSQKEELPTKTMTLRYPCGCEYTFYNDGRQRDITTRLCVCHYIQVDRTFKGYP